MPEKPTPAHLRAVLHGAEHAAEIARWARQVEEGRYTAELVRLGWTPPGAARPVREHLPVKPNRDALAAAIRLRHREMGSGVETVTVDDYESADAVLDLWPGESRAEVKAEALREFADAHRFPSDWIMFRRDDGTGVTVSDMLREGGGDR